MSRSSSTGGMVGPAARIGAPGADRGHHGHARHRGRPFLGDHPAGDDACTWPIRRRGRSRAGRCVGNRTVRLWFRAPGPRPARFDPVRRRVVHRRMRGDRRRGWRLHVLPRHRSGVLVRCELHADQQTGSTSDQEEEHRDQEVAIHGGFPFSIPFFEVGDPTRSTKRPDCRAVIESIPNCGSE